MDLSVYIGGELEKNKTALPKDFNKSRFAQNSVALIKDYKANTGNDLIKEFGINEVMAGLFKGAFLGLDFFTKECYLIPYKNYKQGTKTLNFQIDYRGAKKLAKKYAVNPVKEISAEVVREGDTFKKWIEDGVTRFTFEPEPFNQGNVIGAFAYCVFEDGGTLVDVMNLAELETTRSKSKAKNSGAWNDFTNEMYKKTVLHRLCKQIEIQFENPKQRDLFTDDVAIETDVQEIRNKEVAEKENTINFTEVKVQEPKEEVTDKPKADDEAPEVFNYEV